MEEEKKETEQTNTIPQNNPNQVNYFAETNFRNQPVRFGIKKDDRRRHMYLIGKTGMGKSTAMENMIIQDIVNGEGVCLVDPHGDFAEKILDFIPNERINDVIYLNPADMDYPIAFNVMESTATEYKHLIASGLIGVFKKLWADSWGPRLEYLLRNAILALLDYPGSTLLGVMRILVDKNYRNRVITKIQDPVVRSFWVEEYSKYPQSFQVEAIAPIQNKVGQFLSTAMIRNVVGQVKSTIDMREVMDKQKILILNLSKGRIGEDSSALLGAMMITKIQLAAMSRIDMAEEDRKDFYLYVDEFQNFATESFANILSEARKYRLNLIIAHQYIEQLDEIVRAAVFGNVGTLMVFRVGAADAEFLETEFTPYFLPEDIVNLTKFDIYMKLMIDGVSSNPFSAKTLPPLGADYRTNNRDKVIRVSRERYAKPREVVEDKISRWSASNGFEEEEEALAKKPPAPAGVSAPAAGVPPAPAGRTDYSAPADDAPKKKRKKKKKKKADGTTDSGPRKEGYEVNCYECGQPTTISFRPDGVRPIYCQSCFQKIREKLMRGDTAEIEMEEVKPEAEARQPEISLMDALKKPPQSFDGKPVKAPLPPRAPRPARPQPTPEEIERQNRIADVIDASVALGSRQLSKNSDNGDDVHSIKPGEVVKF